MMNGAIQEPRTFEAKLQSGRLTPQSKDKRSVLKISTLIVALVIVALLLAAACKGAIGSKNKVDGTRAKALVSEGATLLDVRTEGEFQAGHIDGAKLVPVQSLDKRFEDVGPRDKPVVIYCASGMRSAKAARMLTKAGFEEVYDLGSIRSW